MYTHTRARTRVKFRAAEDANIRSARALLWEFSLTQDMRAEDGVGGGCSSGLGVRGCKLPCLLACEWEVVWIT